jgi:hypothetical protein
MYVGAASATMSFISRSRSSAPFLTEFSESAESYISAWIGSNTVCSFKLTLLKASKISLKWTSISPLLTFALSH